MRAGIVRGTAALGRLLLLLPDLVERDHEAARHGRQRVDERRDRRVEAGHDLREEHARATAAWPACATPSASSTRPSTRPPRSASTRVSRADVVERAWPRAPGRARQNATAVGPVSRGATPATSARSAAMRPSVFLTTRNRASRPRRSLRTWASCDHREAAVVGDDHRRGGLELRLERLDDLCLAGSLHVDLHLLPRAGRARLVTTGAARVERQATSPLPGRRTRRLRRASRRPEGSACRRSSATGARVETAA